MFSRVFVLLCVGLTGAKVFERCELARELRYRHATPVDQLATWVCIAQHESNFDTAAAGHLNGDHSVDHGLFQISDLYWCSSPEPGRACGLSCSDLEDDDITDDVACARKIYREHTKLSGNGFNAWTVYASYCIGARVSQYIENCFPVEKDPSPKPLPTHVLRPDVNVEPNTLDANSIKSSDFFKKKFIWDDFLKSVTKSQLKN